MGRVMGPDPGLRGRAGAPARRMLAVIVLTALALRLAATALPNFENLMDADHIHAWEPGNVAEALLAGRGFGSPFESPQVSGQPSAVMPPVYPLIVAVFFRFFGVHTAESIFALHAFNCLLNALACVPVCLMAQRSFGTRAGWWAAWGWALSPYGIYFSAAWAWGTHLLLLCLCWLLVLAQEMEESSRPALWVGFGLLVGFAGLTEPSVLAVAPFLLVLACWRRRSTGERWLGLALVASVALAAAISPWMIRNAKVFHRFIPMRDSMGLELWMGNNGYSLRWTSDQLHPLHDATELAVYNRMGEVAYMDLKAREAKAYIDAHPGWYVWMCARRAVYLWTGFWSLKPDYLALEPMDPPNIPFATALALLAVAGLVAAWRTNRFEAIRYGGILILFPALYYLSHPEPYHLRPLDPLIVILGCVAILAWREGARVKKAAFREAAQEA